MKRIIIEGNKELSGTINIGGAKNSVVALIPAAILAKDVVTLKCVPEITDKDALKEILSFLNVTVVDIDDTLTIDSKNLINMYIDEKMSTKLRASYYMMGVLLGRFKHVEIAFPGGCKIGARPIDLHLAGFEAMGANIKEENNKYIIDAPYLHGANIDLSFASVGATINIILAAVLAEGKTVINNAACEVEIINVCDLLNKMGANIKGAGTKKIEITGVLDLHKAEIEVIKDRIEAGSYIIMGALLGKNLEITGINYKHNEALFNILKKMNVDFKIDNNKVIINKCNNLKAINVKSKVYPGFPTDLGQPMSVLLTQANGKSIFEETIYESRMGHIKYLIDMGANIEYTNKVAIINGPTPLHGSVLCATDLRAGAALVIAGLIATGTTVINDADYILRGYEKIISKLSQVGASIKIEDV